jgi:hypothetical protein
LACILDTVDVYKELLSAIWKDQYKTDLPEGIDLLLGQLKHELGTFPLANTPINEQLYNDG